MIQIIDHRAPYDLEGAEMQFSVERGEYPKSEALAYCLTLEIARAIAHAVATLDEPIVIKEWK